jgi:membrane-bound serine protease (ClpP class)
MRRVCALSCLVAALLGVPAAALAQSSSAPPIEIVKVEGTLDGPLLRFLDERIDLAVSQGATLVLQLDTPGTLDEDGVALGQRLVELPIPVVVWVGTVPAKASGAGLLLLYASSLAAVAPGSQTAPLLPLDMLHPDEVPPGLNETIDGWLEARGRVVDRSQEQRALTAQQALDHGLAEVAAASIPDLLREIDGIEVPTAAGPVVLQTRVATTEAEVQQGGGVSITFTEPGPIERLLHAVASPSMVYFLLAFGLACLAFELTQPGFGFAGFAGVSVVALAAYGLWAAPPELLGSALFLGGIGLLFADVQLRRLGALSALGIVSFTAGSILMYGSVADPIRISPWLIGGVVVATILYYGFGLTVALQSRDRIWEAQQGLIGLVGEARGRLAPDGPVHVKGTMWRGRSVGDPIDPGAKVRVRGVDGMVLRVEAEPAGETEPADV